MWGVNRPLLALKVEKGTTSQGCEYPGETQKGKESKSSLEPQKEHSPADISILTQWELFGLLTYRTVTKYFVLFERTYSVVMFLWQHWKVMQNPLYV